MARDLRIVVSVEKDSAVRGLRDVDAALDKTTATTKTFGLAQAKQTETTVGATAALGMLGKAFAGLLAADVIIKAIKSTLDYASSLEKMKAATDISFKGLQQLENIAVASDTTIERLTSGILDLQRRLATGDDSAVGAFRKLKINVQEFLALKGEEQFFALGRALSDMTNVVQRNKIAYEIWGRGYKEQLASVMSAVDELKNGVHISSDAQIAKLAEVEERWSLFKLSVKRHVLDIVAALHGGTTEEIMVAMGHWLPSVQGQPDMSGLVPAGLSDVSVPSENEQRRLTQAVEDNIKRITKATADAALAAVKANAEYRAFWNFIGERQREDDANRMAVLIARVSPQAMLGLPSGTLPSSDVGPGFMGTPTLMPQVLAQTITWRDTLRDVVNVMGVLGDRWASVAVGILRQTQAIVALWQGGNKNVAIGQAIGAAGQMIPTGTTAGGAASGAAQGAAVGSVFGPIGTAVGAGVGALIGWYQSGKAARQVNDVRDAFIAQAGGLAALDARAHAAGVTLTAMLDARTPAAYEAAIDSLNAALEFQDQSWEALQSAIDRYGFKIEELGPALSQQKLDEQVMQLITDFRLLEGAGVDVETISLHMADAINTYVHNALKAGATVPEAMREILQQLVTMGLLTDENGNLITDLEESGIHFAESLTEQFSTLIDTIQLMVEAIGRFLGITNDAATAVSNFPTFPGGGEGPNPPGIPDKPLPPGNLLAFTQKGGGFSSGGTVVMQPGAVVVHSVIESPQERHRLAVALSGDIQRELDLQSRRSA